MTSKPKEDAEYIVKRFCRELNIQNKYEDWVRLTTLLESAIKVLDERYEQK